MRGITHVSYMSQCGVPDVSRDNPHPSPLDGIHLMLLLLLGDPLIYLLSAQKFKVFIRYGSKKK